VLRAWASICVQCEAATANRIGKGSERHEAGARQRCDLIWMQPPGRPAIRQTGWISATAPGVHETTTVDIGPLDTSIRRFLVSCPNPVLPFAGRLQRHIRFDNIPACKRKFQTCDNAAK
jgi:hypothetical protein